ncbi:MAG: transcription antitermination factor NusB [Verrucomicrobiota bacterium]
MNKRRQARQWAVQFLYQNDVRSLQNLEEELSKFWNLVEKKAEFKKHTEELIRGVIEHQKTLDEWIQACAQNWNLKRIAVVDRNILRLALYEMQYCDDVPPVVAINEAIELAKTLSGGDSKKFVNGILDKAKQGLTRS